MEASKVPSAEDCAGISAFWFRKYTAVRDDTAMYRLSTGVFSYPSCTHKPIRCRRKQGWTKRKRDPHAAEHINENAMESKQTLSVPACRLLKFLFVQDIKTMVCAWFLKSKYPLWFYSGFISVCRNRKLLKNGIHSSPVFFLCMTGVKGCRVW